MGMMLPPELREVLEMVGFAWPATDEDVLKQWAEQFRAMSAEAAAVHTDLGAAVDHVNGCNEGSAVAVIVAQLRSSDSNVDAVDQFRQACDAAATGCDVCANIVIGLKALVVFQLGLLAVSMAAGPAGMFLRQGVKMAIEYAVNKVVAEVMAGDG